MESFDPDPTVLAQLSLSQVLDKQEDCSPIFDFMIFIKRYFEGAEYTDFELTQSQIREVESYEMGKVWRTLDNLSLIVENLEATTREKNNLVARSLGELFEHIKRDREVTERTETSFRKRDRGDINNSSLSHNGDTKDDNDTSVSSPRKRGGDIVFPNRKKDKSEGLLSIEIDKLKKEVEKLKKVQEESDRKLEEMEAS